MKMRNFSTAILILVILIVSLEASENVFLNVKNNVVCFKKGEKVRMK